MYKQIKPCVKILLLYRSIYMYLSYSATAALGSVSAKEYINESWHFNK